MKAFADLFAALDATTRSTVRVAVLADYLSVAPDADRIWAVALLSGRRPRRAVTTADLRRWAAERAGLPDWLFDEAYAAVGDLAETIALVLPDRTYPAPGGAEEGAGLAVWMQRIAALSTLSLQDRRAAVEAAWDRLSGHERLVFNKLVTGGFRVGVGPGLIQRAVARVTGLEPAIVAHRLMGDWDPTRTGFDALMADDDPAAARARPYPFALAHPLDSAPDALGPVTEWVAEWKWDGLRAQIVRRGGAVHLWSRGEEMVTEAFPEVAAAAVQALPDGCVLDGELLGWAGDRPMPFATLQRRIGRKRPTRRLLSEVPVIFVAWDLLEAEGLDLRARPLVDRRARLAALLAQAADSGAILRMSEALAGTADSAGPTAGPPGCPPQPGWDRLAALRATARAQGAEGLMLKRADSPYPAGRPRGPWWKWKLDPHSLDAVLVYAQAGHGRRAGLYTDYTFALRDGDDLVPVAKAYSGLTDAEFREITAWVRRHTLERFGPVRRVVPELVFEIAFEGVQPSSRHRAGLALRFPRMLRWRRDKGPLDADRLETLRAMLPDGTGPDVVRGGAGPNAARRG